MTEVVRTGYNTAKMWYYNDKIGLYPLFIKNLIKEIAKFDSKGHITIKSVNASDCRKMITEKFLKD